MNTTRHAKIDACCSAKLCHTSCLPHRRHTRSANKNRKIFGIRAQGVLRSGSLAATLLARIAEGDGMCRQVAEALLGWTAERTPTCRWLAVSVNRRIAEGTATVLWIAESSTRWLAASVNRWIAEGVFRWTAEGPGVAERSGATPGSV